MDNSLKALLLRMSEYVRDMMDGPLSTAAYTFDSIVDGGQIRDDGYIEEANEAFASAYASLEHLKNVLIRVAKESR